MVSALREHWEKNGRRGWTRTSDPLLRRLAQRFYHFAQVAQVIDFKLTCSQPSLAEIDPIWPSLAQVAHNRHTKIGL